MPRIQVKYIELHSPTFLSGKSFPPKIDTAVKDGHPTLRIEYSPEDQLMYLKYQGPKGYVEASYPMTSVAHFIPGEPEPHDRRPKPTDENAPRKIGDLPSAQVSSPQGHVHAGPGAGKTGTK